MDHVLSTTSSHRVGPTGQRPGRRVYWRYAVPIVAVHLLSLLAFIPSLFSWTGLVLCLIGIPLYGQGINLVYHRLLSHRSLKVPKWLERTFVVGALGSMQDAPARWVAVHRFHHVHADDELDPHSPLRAFLWSHIGWLLFVNRDVEATGFREKYARDILSDSFYRLLDRSEVVRIGIYFAHVAVFFAAGAAFVLASGGPWNEAARFGLSLLVWGGFLRVVAVWHITWSVNSLTHMFGYRNYETGENSRNNWFVGLLSGGEGWHNNHHHDPAAASVQHRWWEVDPTFYSIKALQWAGLATAIVPTKRAQGGRRRSEPRKPR